MEEDWNYTQLITRGRRRVNYRNDEHWSDNGLAGLDTTFGYDALWPYLYMDDGSIVRQSDSPGTPLFMSDMRSCTVHDSFVPYTLYLPPAPGSHLVPLKNWSWHWDAGATADGTGT